MDPLAAKVEIIDLVDADEGDSSSVEVLQEDSDSTMSGQTVRECKQPVALFFIRNIGVVAESYHRFISVRR